jgi:hypothetical protein
MSDRRSSGDQRREKRRLELRHPCGREVTRKAAAASASALKQDGIDGRVFLGIHFRTADEVAIDMGTQIANWGLDHYFQPT